MAAKNKKEKITLENLAANLSGLAKTVDTLTQEMRGGFAESKNAIEELAIITKHGFDGVGEKFDKVDKRFDKLEKTNTREHEEMSLKLDNVAYRFELVELKKRVEVLEKKSAARVEN